MSILLLLKHAEKVLKAYGNFPHAAAPKKTQYDKLPTLIFL